MIVRLGLPKAGGALMKHARALCAPLLLSAGCFGRRVSADTRHAMGAVGYAALASGRLTWPQREFLGRWLRLTHTLVNPDSGIWAMRDEDEGWPDIALDSAGFVAWARHGGYPWPLGQYIELALEYPWTWWSAPDACCEPEIAEDAVEVDFRIRWTASALQGTLVCVDQRRREEAEHAEYFRSLGWPGQGSSRVRDPMPILQGWTPDDYLKSAVWTETVLRGRGRLLPDVLGVGSVCRRKLNSGKATDKDQERRETAGLLRVLDVLHQQLPREIRLHLFGVKTDALPEIDRHFGARVLSVDSQAWDAEARRETNNDRAAGDADASCDNARRCRAMSRWWAAQQAALKTRGQLGLFRASEAA